MYQLDLGGRAACMPGSIQSSSTFDGNSTLVVSPSQCCPGSNFSTVAQCLSIAAGAWLKPEDAACDEVCAQTSGFIASTQGIATLQYVSVAIGTVPPRSACSYLQVFALLPLN